VLVQQRERSTVIVFLIFFSCISGWKCDEGLAPASISQPPPYGIRGTIYFRHWPPSDSIKDLRLAALKNYPVSDIIAEVLQGRARYTDQLQPYGADSLDYTLTLSPLSTGLFPYIAVAMQFGPNIQHDWRVVGVYYANGDTTVPGSVVVPPDSIVPGINIHVDFLNPPPQPM
jgi:hypothetical protein